MISGKTYPSSYQAANNMLRRMEQRKEVKVHDLSRFGLSDMFMLPSTPRLKSADKFRHEQAGADLFVAYNLYAKRWIHEPFILSKRADRGVQFEGGLTIYFEVDRVTENFQDLRDKVENYIVYGNEAKERFHVVFDFVGEHQRVVKRAKKMGEFLQQKKRNDQFLLAQHPTLIANPMGRVLFSPRDEILSIPDIISVL